MRYLPDVNVWLAMVYEGHENHRKAHTWWSGEGYPELLLIRESKNSLLRLLTNATVMKTDVSTSRDAWKIVDLLNSHPAINWFGEPWEADDVFRRCSVKLSKPASAWTDSWLLAMAECAQCKLVTLDKGLANRDPSRTMLIG